MRLAILLLASCPSLVACLDEDVSTTEIGDEVVVLTDCRASTSPFQYAYNALLSAPTAAAGTSTTDSYTQRPREHRVSQREDDREGHPRAAVELAMLSMLAHPEREIMRELVAEIAMSSSVDPMLYLKLLRHFIPTLETEMQTLAELKQQVADEREALRAEGRAEGHAELAMKVARSKLGDLSAALGERIATYPDVEGLILALATAHDIEAARGVLVARGLLDE